MLGFDVSEKNDKINENYFALLDASLGGLATLASVTQCTGVAKALRFARPTCIKAQFPNGTTAFLPSQQRLGEIVKDEQKTQSKTQRENKRVYQSEATLLCWNFQLAAKILLVRAQIHGFKSVCLSHSHRSWEGLCQPFESPSSNPPWKETRHLEHNSQPLEKAVSICVLK